MSETETKPSVDITLLWRLKELRRLGFNLRQRQRLLRRIEAGEIELAEIRDLVEEKGCPVEEAWWIVS